MTFLLLGLVPILGKLTGTSLDFAGLAKQASEATGVPWTSSLWNMLQLAWAEPGLGLLILGSFVPTLAAIVVLGLMRDRRQWREFFGRFHPLKNVSLSTAASQYGLLFAGMLVCLSVVFLLRQLVAPELYTNSGLTAGPGIIGAILVAAFLDQGAVLEEGGWRGFATPLLQTVGASPLRAALLVGVVWSLWHLPRDVVSAVVFELGPWKYFLLYLPAFTLGCVAVSIIATYFMNRLGGSILPAIVAHGLANDSMGLSGTAAFEQLLTPLHQYTQAIPLLLFAVVIIILAGPELGQKG